MRRAFFFVVGAAAIFVWWSSSALPDPVASHFVAGGVANGFTSRAQYIGFMVAFVVVAPSLLALIGRLASYLPTEFVNLPNKEFWLAPERRATTLVFLGTFGVWSAYAVLAFLCQLHWFVIQANMRTPPRLEQPPLLGAASLLLIALFCGMLVVLRRFSRVP